MVDSDKIVSLNSLVEHTDMSVLKNISHITGGPSSIASTGKTICYPNKIIPKVEHKIPKIKRTKLFLSSTGESKFSTKSFDRNNDLMGNTRGEKIYYLSALFTLMNTIYYCSCYHIFCYYCHFIFIILLLLLLLL